MRVEDEACETDRRPCLPIVDIGPVVAVGKGQDLCFGSQGMFLFIAVLYTSLIRSRSHSALRIPSTAQPPGPAGLVYLINDPDSPHRHHRRCRGGVPDYVDGPDSQVSINVDCLAN